MDVTSSRPYSISGSFKTDWYPNVGPARPGLVLSLAGKVIHLTVCCVRVAKASERYWCLSRAAAALQELSVDLQKVCLAIINLSQRI